MGKRVGGFPAENGVCVFACVCLRACVRVFACMCVQQKQKSIFPKAYGDEKQVKDCSPYK